MIEIKYLPYKDTPTWVVKYDGEEVFFSANNGSVFDPPYERAMRFYNKMKDE